MRGVMGTLIIFLVCLVLVVLYIFLGKGQISLAAAKLEVQIEEKESELTAIRGKQSKIPVLKASLPVWREQLQIFNTAIPVKVNDHVFFSSLADQLEPNSDVKLLSLDSVFGGPWLGEVSEEQEEVLTGYGIDVESARSIRVSFFTLKLLGEFDDVLMVIENLKKYRRLYTIDMIAGPATGGSGAVAQNAEPEITPIQVTGRLYFNLPEPMVDVNELNRMYLEVFAGMLQNDMVAAGEQALNGQEYLTPPVADDVELNEGDAENEGELVDKAAGEVQQTDGNPGDIALAGLGSPAQAGI